MRKPQLEENIDDFLKRVENIYHNRILPDKDNVNWIDGFNEWNENEIGGII